MRKLIALGGEPATGKTTIMRGIIAALTARGANWHEFKYELVRGIYCPRHRVLILGIYDDQTFAGTDRLSMAVITSAKKLLEPLKGFEDVVCLFEGDRLFNTAFLTFAKSKVFTEIFCLKASESAKTKRHKLRGDTQSETWLQGRATKVKNILEAFPEAMVFSNEDEIEQSRAIEEIIKKIF